MLTVEMIHKAQKRIKSYIYETPLLHLINLEEYLGCKAYAKMETMQKTNSFKIRGATNRLMTLPSETLKKGIITVSSGNHGKAIAYTAKWLGIPARIVIPKNAPLEKVAGIRSFGSEIIFSSLEERFSLGEKLSKENDWTFISPFDDYEVMAGQGTAGLEILNSLPDVNYIVVPIGGGGLISGIATAIKETSPHVKVIGVEPTTCARYTHSFSCGAPTSLEPNSSSIADGLQTLSPGIRNYPIIKKYVDDIVTVDEDHIKKATKFLLTKGKMLAETSACITLGAILQNKLKVNADDKVVFFLSGGNIGINQIKAFETCNYED